MTTEARRTLGSEQSRAVEASWVLAKPYRFCVHAQAEGFPVIPERYVQVEWCEFSTVVRARSSDSDDS
jgi:hypothetical protein